MIPVFALCLMACGKKFEASKVHEGMSKQELLSACGQPDSITPYILSEMYRYGKAGLAVQDDTVKHIMLDYQAEMLKAAMAIKAALSPMPAEFAELRVGMTPYDIGYLLPEMTDEDATQLQSGETWVYWKGWLIELDTSLHVTRWMPQQPSLDSVMVLQPQ